jgi:hypothetical protein
MSFPSSPFENNFQSSETGSLFQVFLIYCHIYTSNIRHPCKAESIREKNSIKGTKHYSIYTRTYISNLQCNTALVHQCIEHNKDELKQNKNGEIIT